MYVWFWEAKWGNKCFEDRCRCGSGPLCDTGAATCMRGDGARPATRSSAATMACFCTGVYFQPRGALANRSLRYIPREHNKSNHNLLVHLEAVRLGV